MLTHVLQACLLVLVCLLALLAVEISDVFLAVIPLLGMSIALGALFWLMAAPYIAVFQLLIYGGAVVALFIVTVTLTATKGKRRANLKMDVTWGMGTVVSIAVILLILAVIQIRPFPIFRNVQYMVTFAEAFTSRVAENVSHLLWQERSSDLIAQAFVLFAAVLGCIALLRPGRKGGSE